MAQKQQLVRRGVRDSHLTAAVRSGEVTRARQGWYTTLDPGDVRVRAVRVGGRLTGISAIERWGGWVLGGHPLHVSVRDNAARLRSPSNRHVRLRPGDPRVVLHWDGIEREDRGTSMEVALEDALLRVIIDESLETAVAVLDWALHTNALDEFDFELLMLRLPKNRRFIRHWVDARCDSLPESLARTRLRLSGHRVVTQVGIPSIEWIDLVVDGVAALEVDGREFHQDRFERDRRKDVNITLFGLHALRATAQMVFNDWGFVQAGVRAALAQHAAAAPTSLLPPLEIQESYLVRRGKRRFRPPIEATRRLKS
jgi:very-short-patch-repair endonuclease